MFNWYNPKAKKNTIIGYLSRKYTKAQLANLPDNSVLALPDTFESGDYSEELNTIFTDSPWKTVKYTPASTKSLSGVFSAVKQRLFGKKQEVGEENSDTSSDNSDNSETDQNSQKSTDDDHLLGSFSADQHTSNSERRFILPKREHEVHSETSSLASAEETSQSPLSTSIYHDANESDIETSSVASNESKISLQAQIDQKIANIQVAQDKLAKKLPKENWKELEAELLDWIKQNQTQKKQLEQELELAKSQTPLTTYQFRLNEAGRIVLWKELGQKLQEEPYQNCFFETNKTYRNCWVTAQTAQPLPTELPKGVNCLFELVKTVEELRQKNDWDYCLVTEFQPAEESETSESEESDNETETPSPKGTYRYEFATDTKGLISAWRTPSVSWKADVYHKKYFALDVAKYANSYLKVKTLDSLPRNLPTTRYLFSPCANENDFYSREPNWINCLVWEQEPLNKLKQCLDCHTYLTPLNPTNYCESCLVKTHQTPLKSFWESNKNLLIIAGIIALAIIVYQSQ